MTSKSVFEPVNGDENIKHNFIPEYCAHIPGTEGVKPNFVPAAWAGPILEALKQNTLMQVVPPQPVSRWRRLTWPVRKFRKRLLASIQEFKYEWKSW
jgi:hypothetical protein